VHEIMMRKRTLFLLAILLLLSLPTVAGNRSISQVLKQVKDSVVVISTTETEAPSMAGALPTAVGGLGSGVLIEGGYVLTAAHVVQVADQILVEFTNGEAIFAEVQGSVPAADLALLRLERAPEDARPAPLGDSDHDEVGDQIFIVGAPLGITHTLTVGHISARRLTDELFGGLIESEMFQTDAAINVGNSGGPMFNMKGEVIGIVSHMISQTGSYDGLGFAMTSNLARDLLIRERSTWSGFEGYTLRGELAAIFNLPQSTGVLVQRVARNSPAAQFGLRPGTMPAVIDGEPIVLGGDILLGVDDISVADPDATRRIREHLETGSQGADLTLTVLRAGRIVELTATRDEP